MVCLFLAEQLRVRKISLPRAAEIAQKVVSNINLLDSEQDFLRLVKELAKDFEELVRLEERVFFWVDINHRKVMEENVRGCVVEMIGQDPVFALELLNMAIKDGATVEDLKIKFPQFAAFLTKTYAESRKL